MAGSATLAAEVGGVIALIPAYEEAERVGAVVTAALSRLPVLVVDDGSTDGTATVAADAGATVVVQVPNRGKGSALRAGFAWALARDVEAVVTLDADGQHDPAEIPAFLDAHRRTGADLVIGRRDFHRMPPTRRLANELGRRAMSWAAGRDIPDNQSGYRLLSRRLMAALETSEEAGFEFEVEMITTCIRAGFVLEWVPIRTIYAGEASHIQPLRHLSSFVRIVRTTRRTVRTPLP